MRYLQTCDKRGTKSSFLQRFPFKIEEGFTEEDELWEPHVRETPKQQTARLEQAMSDFFDEDSDSLYVSLSAHSGTIRAVLEAVHFPRVYSLMTGGMIPVVGVFCYFCSSTWLSMLTTMHRAVKGTKKA